MNTVLDIDSLVDSCEGFEDLCRIVRGEVREFVQSFCCYPSFFTVSKVNFDVIRSLMDDYFDSRGVAFVRDGVGGDVSHYDDDIILEGYEVVCRG